MYDISNLRGFLYDFPVFLSISCSKLFICQLPVKLLGCVGASIVKINIEGYPYSMKVDLGSNETLSLQSRYIKNIKQEKNLKNQK